MEVKGLIRRLVTEEYGRRHPKVVIGDEARIDLPYQARQLAKLMLRKHEDDFMRAMDGTSWTDKDGKRRMLPHPTFVEKTIRLMPYVKFDSYFGEYFSCRYCLEKDLSWHAVVKTLTKAHKGWSSMCSTRECDCGKFEHRTLRNKQVVHAASCNGRCTCPDCTELFVKLESFQDFIFEGIRCVFVLSAQFQFLRCYFCITHNYSNALYIFFVVIISMHIIIPMH